MRYAIIFFILISILQTRAQPISPDDIVGTWMTEDNKGEITIYREGDYYLGKITAGSGEQKLDIHNPDKARRNDPLIGLIILKDLEYDGENKWGGGTVYDPKSGKKYSCHLTMLSEDRLKITGYIGFSFIGRSEEWRRKNDLK